MSVSFQSPWFLAALPLAAAPWLLHRWSLSRARRMPFPSVELLREALRASFVSSLLSHRLLLAIRTAALLVLLLWAARPVLRLERGGGDVPRQVILLLDNSASMGARVDGREALAWAAAEAAAFGASDSGSPGAVLFSDRVEASLPPGAGPARLREFLSRLSPSARPTRAEAGLAAAYRQLAGMDGEKAVVLFSDAARHGWRFQGSPEGFDPAVRLVVARPPLPAGNVGIADVRLPSSPGDRGRISVAAWGAASAREWTLSWDGRPAARGAIRAGGLSSGEVPFVPADPSAAGEVSLDVDGLAADDVRHVLPPAFFNPGILLVNGAPSLGPSSGETYYLEAALEALRREGARMKTVLPEELSTRLLAGWDVVVLANPPALSPSAAKALRLFVESGGGLWVTAGSNLDPASLGPLLSARPTGGRWSGEGLSLPGDGVPPAVRRLSEEGGYEWRKLRVDDALEVSPGPGSEVLLIGGGGEPLLVAGKYGRGRTAFLATTADRDWTNLPSRPFFPVLCREVVRSLSRRGGDAAASLHVDQVWEVPLPGGGGEWAVLRPDGKTDAWRGGGGMMRYDRTGLPGVYSLKDLRGGEVVARAAVNLDVAGGEGDLTPVTPAELEERLPGAEVLWIDPPSPVKETFNARFRGQPLSPVLAFLAACFLFFETAVLAWRKT